MRIKYLMLAYSIRINSKFGHHLGRREGGGGGGGGGRGVSLTSDWYEPNILNISKTLSVIWN